MLEAVASLRMQYNLLRSVSDQSLYDGILGKVVGQLDTSTLAAIHIKGSAMSFVDVVQYALETIISANGHKLIYRSYYLKALLFFLSKGLSASLFFVLIPGR